MENDTVNEVWRAVPRYEGCYEVSNQGRVRSLPRRKAPGRVLRPLKHTGGYARIMLWKDGVPWQTFVHRLVALAFLGPAPAGTQVAHGNGDKQDNRVTNLRWATPSQNQADRELHGTGRVGVPRERSNRKLGVERARAIRALCAELNGNITATAEATGLSRTTVADVVNQRTWREKGVDVLATAVSNSSTR